MAKERPVQKMAMHAEAPAEEVQTPAAPLLPEGADLPQSVALTAFCHNQFGGKHLDQAGGFAFWARKAGHTRHTVAEWRALLGEFSNRPVGAQS